MALKNITIDIEAYNLLAAEKMGEESFSMVIKRLLRPVHTASNLLQNLDRVMVSDSTLDKTEEIINARKKSFANSPVIEE